MILMFYLIYFDFSIKDSLIIILSEMFSLKITVVSDIYFDILSTTDVIYSHCIEKNNLKLMTIHSICHLYNNLFDLKNT